MKTQSIFMTISVPTLVDVQRFRFMGLGSGAVVAGAKALGVVETNTRAGSIAPVNLCGVLLAEAGAAITAGVEVEVNALGQVITKTTGVGNGYAMDAAVQAGDIIRIVRGI